ncbi:MAG: hypothetical protein LBT47_11695 [Deltaproteobacteria bacterium]|jgi:hypothetical protein|nr:hypothetical protein [Deltaproteobacteria bacterium]
MFIFWGIIGFFQSIFLPGAVICASLSKEKIGFSKFLVTSFIYSLAANYALICIFLIFGIYTKLPMLITLLLESLYLIYYCYARTKYKIEIKNYDIFKGDPEQSAKYKLVCYTIFTIVISLAALLVFSFFHKTVYIHIDAINSWDSWARSWASNQYPRTYGDYPQLVPIIMSIPYVFMGSDTIQLFSILSFEFFVLPGLFALYTLRKSSLSFPAVTCAVILLWLNSATRAIAPDIHLGTVAVISFVALQWHLIDLSHGDNEKFYLFTAFLAAAISAVMKQTGLIWYFLFILVSVYHFRNVGLHYNAIIKRILPSAFIALLFCISWYFFNTYLIYIGLVPTKLVSIFTNPAYYRDRSFIYRAVYCFFHYSYYSIFILPCLRCLFIKRFYPIAISALVFFGGWIVFLSYNSANGKLPVLLSAFSLGFCLEEALKKNQLSAIKRQISGFFLYFYNRGLKGLIYGMISFLLIIFIVALPFSDRINNFLINSRNKQVLKIGDIGLQRRVDYLLKTNPQKLFTCDGRLLQLGSLPPGYYHYCDQADTLKDYGYLVLTRAGQARINQEELARDFRLDYQETQFSLFIRKSLY